MAISATITNVTKDGKGFRVFYRFSDGDDSNQLFNEDVTQEQIQQAIKKEVDLKRDLVEKVATFQTLIGMEIG